MAGSGQRFIDAGYKDPKYFIKIRGKHMIDYVCDMFNRDSDEFVFIVDVKVYQNARTRFDSFQKSFKNAVILTIPSHARGPVWSVFTIACDYIEKEKPVIIVHCDTPFKWDYNIFIDFAGNKDGVLVSNTGFHPHSLSSTLMAHSKTDINNKILEVREKDCYTLNHFNEHASAGLYYFSKGEYIYKYFGELIENNINYNGEFYVTLAYNLMIKDGLQVYSYPVEYVLSFGTPADVENFEAWQTILDGAQVKNHEHLISCYNYWKRYRGLCRL